MNSPSPVPSASPLAPHGTVEVHETLAATVPPDPAAALSRAADATERNAVIAKHRAAVAEVQGKVLAAWCAKEAAFGFQVPAHERARLAALMSLQGFAAVTGHAAVRNAPLPPPPRYDVQDIPADRVGVAPWNIPPHDPTPAPARAALAEVSPPVVSPPPRPAPTQPAPLPYEPWVPPAVSLGGKPRTAADTAASLARTAAASEGAMFTEDVKFDLSDAALDDETTSEPPAKKAAPDPPVNSTDSIKHRSRQERRGGKGRRS